MAIIGTHMLFYTEEAEALRKTLSEAFGFKSIDAGGGWLIFAMPPAELGVHPAEGSTHGSGVRHQISFMCDDIHATVTDLRAKGIAIEGEPKDERWGITAMMTLPGDLKVMLYQPLHALAIGSEK
jgi:hypothetical protein